MEVGCVWGVDVVSKEYEKELEKTIEHLHKVVEEKTILIDQQRVMIDKFMKGEISINSDAGYINAPSYAAVSTGPLNGSGSFGQPSYTEYKSVFISKSDSSSSISDQYIDIDKPDTNEPL